MQRNDQFADYCCGYLSWAMLTIAPVVKLPETGKCKRLPAENREAQRYGSFGPLGQESESS